MIDERSTDNKHHHRHHDVRHDDKHTRIGHTDIDINNNNIKNVTVLKEERSNKVS